MGIPLFWALHHAAQPSREAACSIALVNAIGNLGGFLGPALIGTLHDSAALTAAACNLGMAGRAGTQNDSSGCFAQWGAGTLALGFIFLGTSAYRKWTEQ